MTRKQAPVFLRYNLVLNCEVSPQGKHEVLFCIRTDSSFSVYSPCMHSLEADAAERLGARSCLKLINLVTKPQDFEFYSTHSKLKKTLETLTNFERSPWSDRTAATLAPLVERIFNVQGNRKGMIVKNEGMATIADMRNKHLNRIFFGPHFETAQRLNVYPFVWLSEGRIGYRATQAHPREVLVLTDGKWVLKNDWVVGPDLHKDHQCLTCGKEYGNIDSHVQRDKHATSVKRKLAKLIQYLELRPRGSQS